MEPGEESLSDKIVARYKKRKGNYAVCDEINVPHKSLPPLSPGNMNRYYPGKVTK